MISYKLYGTEAGVGTATAEGEPAGYKITLSVNDTPMSIYIGDSKLGAEEYVDFEDQKVYKRTANLLNDALATNQVPVLLNNEEQYAESDIFSGVFIPVQPSTRYTGWNLDTTTTANTRYVFFCDVNKNILGHQQYSVTSNPKPINTTADTAYICVPVRNTQLGVSAMVTEGTTEPETFIPYLQPTDPPVPLPTIQAYQGENTLSITETLGDVEFAGDWTAIMGSTDQSELEIGITVDADSYIARLTVDDDPTIQVFDTITMPSSAGSFTLQVVSWGREQYTDTVYNALT